jgi:hypothetical protein
VDPHKSEGARFLGCCIVEAHDFTKLGSEREALMTQLAAKKEQAFHDAFMKRVKERAKIEQNKELVNGQEG